MRLWVQSLALLSELRIQLCCELCCGLQTRLGSRVAVILAYAGGCNSDSTPSLGPSICCGSGPRKDKKKKKKNCLAQRKKELYASVLEKLSPPCFIIEDADITTLPKAS